jgi:hypothetical protein
MEDFSTKKDIVYEQWSSYYEPDGSRVKKYYSSTDENDKSLFLWWISLGLVLVVCAIWLLSASDGLSSWLKKEFNPETVKTPVIAPVLKIAPFSTGQVFTIEPGESADVMSPTGKKTFRFAGFTGRQGEDEYTIGLAVPDPYSQTREDKVTTFIIKKESKFTYLKTQFEVLDIDGVNNSVTLQVK